MSLNDDFWVLLSAYPAGSRHGLAGALRMATEFEEQPVVEIAHQHFEADAGCKLAGVDISILALRRGLLGRLKARAHWR